MHRTTAVVFKAYVDQEMPPRPALTHSLMPYSNQQHLSDKSRPIYKRMRRRAKHREHFFDHPKYAEGHPDAFAGAGRTHDKVKVWCKRCFQARLAYERTRDALAGTLRADTAIIEHSAPLTSTLR